MPNNAKKNKKNKKRPKQRHNAKNSGIFAGRLLPLPKLLRHQKAAPGVSLRAVKKHVKSLQTCFYSC
jgi:hypothetical protein